MLFDRVTLYSPLSAEECQTRLRWALNTSPLSPAKSFAGSVYLKRLAIHKRIYGRRSFQTQYVGKFSDRPDNRGTVIQGQMRLLPGDVLFTMVYFSWLGWLVLTLSVPTAFTYCFGDISSLSAHWLSDILCPPLFMLFGAALVVINRYCARNEEDDILGFLLTTIEARELDDG